MTKPQAVVAQGATGAAPKLRAKKPEADEATGPRLLIPAREAAAMLSMGKSTFWREVKNGRLPQPVKFGGCTRWRVSELKQCVETPTSPTTTA